jgi:hypothetical protein
MRNTVPTAAQTCMLLTSGQGGGGTTPPPLNNPEGGRGGAGSARGDPPSSRLIAARIRASRLFSLITRHRATGRHVIPLPATQGPATEIPAGSWPGLVDGTAPLRNPAPVRFFLFQVPAGRIGKEVPVRFPQPPFAEVVQLMGLALPDKNQGQPAAAFTAAAADAGRRNWMRLFHTGTVGSHHA